MALFPLVYFLMLGSGQQRTAPPAAPVALYLRFRVVDDEQGVELLEYLDQVGTVVSMMNFDGENLEVIWRGNSEKSAHSLDVALEDAGIEVVERRVAKVSGT